MKKENKNNYLFRVLILFGLFVAVLAGWLIVVISLDKQDARDTIITVIEEPTFPDVPSNNDGDEDPIVEEVDTAVEVGTETEGEENSEDEEAEPAASDSSVEASVEVQ